MRIGWTRQPRGAQRSAAQCTCHAPQSNNSDEGAQWWPSEPLTTATFAGTLRGRSAKEREEEERILLLVLGFCFGSCWKIICFSFGENSAAGPGSSRQVCGPGQGHLPRPRAAAAREASSGSCFVSWRVQIGKKKRRRRILLAGGALAERRRRGGGATIVVMFFDL